MPVLPYRHRLSKLYLQEAHTKDHGGRDSRGDEVTGKGVDSDAPRVWPRGSVITASPAGIWPSGALLIVCNGGGAVVDLFGPINFVDPNN